MKEANVIFVAVGLLLALVAWTGCSQAGKEKARHQLGTEASEEHQGVMASTFNDAKLYCLGMLLYAQKHLMECPTNLSQTLPYLRTAHRLPSGTNHFEILYHGSLDKLPNPMTKGIVVIRSDAWKTPDGRWVRIYGFADGHCERHYASDDNFSAWEKQHSLTP